MIMKINKINNLKLIGWKGSQYFEICYFRYPGVNDFSSVYAICIVLHIFNYNYCFTDGLMIGIQLINMSFWIIVLNLLILILF